MGTNLQLGGRWLKPPCLSIKVWHREDISWAQNQNSSIKLKIVPKDKKNTLLAIGIMGGGIVQLIRTALPLYPCPHLDGNTRYHMGMSAHDQATLQESRIFNSCLNSRNLASSRGLVKMSASWSCVPT
jgi:hypothetical protein